MSFYVTGDIHGNLNRIYNFCDNYKTQDTDALIILGDVGFNYYLNKTDQKNKNIVQHLGCKIYCVRGNHEERPENLSTIKTIYDPTVGNDVWYEEAYPNIRYLKDGYTYAFDGYTALVLGGAYSVDKYYRIGQAQSQGIDCTKHWCGWFQDEQLTEQEMREIQQNVTGKTFDFILSHTCPYEWQPFDLFLSSVNQSTVDNTMERWMNDLKNQIHWNHAWLFGHFHADRIVRPHVEMFMSDICPLEEIANRWKDWDDGYKLDWWLELDPTWPFWNEEMDKRKYKSSTFGEIEE
jgi:3-oxoacid CoA-transferase subunit A